MKKYIIAIDGPAGAGKSTIARKLAARLGYLYIDSGAMYRAVTLKALDAGIDLGNAAALTALAQTARIELVPNGERLAVILDGREVTDAIREARIAQHITRVSAVPGVRAALRGKQQEWGRSGGVVMEGRDIGTAVFPKANFKFYLDATMEERANRRFAEMTANGMTADRTAIEASIRERDARDQSRAESPLSVALGAVIINSTHLTAEHVVDTLFAAVTGKPASGGTPTVKSHWLFYFGRFLFRVLFSTVWRRQVYGQEHIPVTGGMIIAPNHCSMADPPLVGSSMRRALFFMAKKELFDVPVLGFLIRRTNAFPVQRGKQDIGAFRNAVKLLTAGAAVLMFPEGTRSRDGAFGKARAGTGMIACMAGVPVVPVRIINANRLVGLRQLTVIFGKPLYPPAESTRETYQQFSEQVLEEIKKLQVPAA